MYSTIVVGTDGSATAQVAVTRAGQLAALCGAEVHLVHGCGSQTTIVDPMGGAAVVMTDDDLETLEERLEPLAEELRARGIHTTVHVVAQSGADAILTCAEDVGADLIVVGNRGMTSKRRFILGSVPNTISHHAPCAVLIVKSD